MRAPPEKLALRAPVFVGPTAEVMFEGRPYSMPPRAANVAGTAFVYEDRVRIVAGRHEAEHSRGKSGDPPASLPEHRAAKLAAVHAGRARTSEMRQQILNLGADALTLMTALVHASPKRVTELVERLYTLFERHGEDAMRAVMSRAVADRTLSVAAVQRALASSARGQVERELDRTRAAHPRGARASTTRKPSRRAGSTGGRR